MVPGMANGDVLPTERCRPVGSLSPSFLETFGARVEVAGVNL